MNINPQPDQSESPWRKWARHELELPDGQSVNLEQEFCQRLADCNFIPPVAWREALELLRSGEDQPDGNVGESRSLRRDCYISSVETRLREEVESFGQQFFKTPPDERRRKWQELAIQCEPIPVLRERLRAMEAGLAIDPSADAFKSHHPTNPCVAELLEQLLRVSVLPPAERAEYRRQLVRQHGPSAEWRAAAAHVLRTDPALAALESTCLRQMASWNRAQEALVKARSQRRSRPRPVELAPQRREQETRFPWWALLPILLIVSQAFRFSHRGNFNPPGNFNYVSPNFYPPASPQVEAILDRALNDSDPSNESLRRLLSQPTSPTKTVPVEGTEPDNPGASPGTAPASPAVPANSSPDASRQRAGVLFQQYRERKEQGLPLRPTPQLPKEPVYGPAPP